MKFNKIGETMTYKIVDSYNNIGGDNLIGDNRQEVPIKVNDEFYIDFDKSETYPPLVKGDMIEKNSYVLLIRENGVNYKFKILRYKVQFINSEFNTEILPTNLLIKGILWEQI